MYLFTDGDEMRWNESHGQGRSNLNLFPIAEVLKD